ncbi:MAG: Uncharacterised protein [Flavobacteriia bacterium]|nr:MAG: Uncharacterised protein [Flavobacteriia bacterium]
MELTGSIKLIQEEERISDRFKKRGLVLTTQEQYPQDIMIEFVQEKTELLDSFQQGQQVTISINIRGREWKSPNGEVKYFTSIQGWRIQKTEAEAPGMQQPMGGPKDTAPQAPAPDLSDKDGDDLPF